jgi:chromosomal replication initiator protein DnaA
LISQNEPKAEKFLISSLFSIWVRVLARKFPLPKGKIVRTIEGGPGSLKKLLLDLKKYYFDGYISTSLGKEKSATMGYILLRGGKPINFLHIEGETDTHGEESLKKIWADSYRKECEIGLHAKVDLDDLAKVMEEGIEEKDPRFVELQEKLEAWKGSDYAIGDLETYLDGDIDAAVERFADYEKRISRLQEIRTRVDGLETEKFKMDIEELQSRLNDPSSLSEVLTDLKILEDRVSMEMEKPGVEAEVPESADETEATAEVEGEATADAVEDEPDDVYEMILKKQTKEGDMKGDMILEEDMERDERTNLISHFVFDGFVVGPSNRFAYAACLAVARTPYKAYNPLFVTSGPGLGKTHLISAIGNFIAEKDKKSNVLYLTTEKFSNEYRQAVKDGKLAKFRKRYRNVDVFLLDDAQFLEAREDVQEELFHTFNALYESNKQIALTSDRPPKEIPNLQDRLVSRFEAGLIADIQPPEMRTRIAILRRKAREMGVDVSGDVLSLIATLVTDNIRELEGALNRVMAFSSLMDIPITESMAREVLKELTSEEDQVKWDAKVEETVPDLNEGRTYLVEEERPQNCFKLLQGSLKGAKNGLVITRTNPNRAREKYSISDGRIIWLTDRESTTEETLPPVLERLVFVIEEFIIEEKVGTILLDGLEYLISNNSFESVLRFLRQLIDEVSESKCVLLISTSPKTLKERELKILERETETISFL